VTDQPGIPGTAPPAKQMGRYVGRLIAARVAGGHSPPPFRYRHLGDLATIGRRAAVVKLGRLELTGLPRKYRPFLQTRFRQPSGP
jgi:NADH:ubiquinone reductase (H+-translocating)